MGLRAWPNRPRLPETGARLGPDRWDGLVHHTNRLDSDYACACLHMLNEYVEFKGNVSARRQRESPLLCISGTVFSSSSEVGRMFGSRALFPALVVSSLPSLFSSHFVLLSDCGFFSQGVRRALAGGSIASCLVEHFAAPPCVFLLRVIDGLEVIDPSVSAEVVVGHWNLCDTTRHDVHRISLFPCG